MTIFSTAVCFESASQHCLVEKAAVFLEHFRGILSRWIQELASVWV